MAKEIVFCDECNHDELPEILTNGRGIFRGTLSAALAAGWVDWNGRHTCPDCLGNPRAARTAPDQATLNRSVPRFEKGDRVRWRSQAAGVWKDKEGTVFEVVPKGCLPETRINFSGSASMPRDHESYVVHVSQRKLYWPRASALKAY